MRGVEVSQDAHWSAAGQHGLVPTPAGSALRRAVEAFAAAAEPGCRHARGDVAVVGMLADPMRQVWCAPCALHRAYALGVQPIACDLCGEAFAVASAATFTTAGRVTVVAAVCSTCPAI